MSVLKPNIDSVINGSITISVASIIAVGALFDQLLISKASDINGPYTELSGVSPVTLAGLDEYVVVDLLSGPEFYYRAQYYNSGSMISSAFSNPAQETGVFSEYSVPESTATYPPEIALSDQDREIVESIRITLGDLGGIERDSYSVTGTQADISCREQISADLCTWELREYRGWPRKVVLNGDSKTSLQDPQVFGYRYLTFSGGTACITGSLDIFYNTFRYADREILLAYDRSRNLLVACGLSEVQVTTEMRIMQASILLLEGESRQAQESAVMIRDGETTYDNTLGLRSRTDDLLDLKQKMRDLVLCAQTYNSYSLEGVRID